MVSHWLSCWCGWLEISRTWRVCFSSLLSFILLSGWRRTFISLSPKPYQLGHIRCKSSAFKDHVLTITRCCLGRTRPNHDRSRNLLLHRRHSPNHPSSLLPNQECARKERIRGFSGRNRRRTTTQQTTKQ